MTKDYLDLEKLEQGDSPFKVRWTAKSRSSMMASSVVAGGALVVADSNGTVISTDIETGKRLWTSKVDIGWVREPLQFLAGKIWITGSKGGAIIGLSPDDGSISVQYEVPHKTNNLVCHEHNLLFLDLITRSGGQEGVLRSYQDNLKTPLFKVSFDEGVIKNLALCPDGNSYLIARNSVVEKYSLPDRQKMQTWEIPSWPLAGNFGYLGIIAFQNGWVLVRNTPSGSLIERRTNYPNPGIIAIGDELHTLPYDLYGASYYMRAIDLPDGQSLVAIGDLVLKVAKGGLAASALLPDSRIWHNAGAGIFLSGSDPIMFKVIQRTAPDGHPPEDLGYYIQPYSCDPDTLQFAPMGIAMKVSGQGKNFFSPRVDQFGSDFVFRGDSRFHFLSLPPAT